MKEPSHQPGPLTAQPSRAAAPAPEAHGFAAAPGALQRTLPDPRALRPEAILQLQRQIGNRAVGRMLAASRPSAPARQVQRKRTYVNYQGNHVDVIHDKLRALEEREKLEPPLTETEFIYGLSGLTVSPLDYGVIDLEDEQHLMLLYSYIRKQAQPLKREEKRTVTRDDGTVEPEVEESRIEAQEEEARQEREQVKKLLAERTDAGKTSYRVAFLGAGASIAYYLATQRFERDEAVIIGTDQPWGGQRGPGVVAHPAHMITPMLQFLGETAIDDRWLERGKFSKLVEMVLARAGIPRIYAKVTALDREEADAGGFYAITVEDRDAPVYAQEVVAGIGVGEHIPPAGVGAEKIARHGGQVGPDRRIMDMDVFTQVSHRLKKTEAGVEVAEGGDPGAITVVLSGANGGIDVAFDALKLGYKVHWIVGSTGPKFLPGFFNYAAYLAYLRSLTPDQRDIAKIDLKKETDKADAILDGLYENQEEEIFKGALELFRKDSTRFEGIHFGRSGAVEETAKGVKVTVGKAAVEGDIMVYAQGQGPGNFALFNKFLDDLVPEKDVSRRFTEKGDTTIGLRSGDDTLKIVGATAFRLAPEVAATREEMEAHDDQLFDALGLVGALPSGNLDYMEFSRVWNAHHDLMRAAHPLDEDAKPEQVKQIKGFAAACRAYGEYTPKLKDVGLTEEEAKALKAFDAVLAKARSNSQGLMKPVIDSLPDNVLINDQLTPSRSQIVASTGFLPYDIGQRANFVTDDRTALAAHISARYGKLADSLDSAGFEKLVGTIIASRTKKVDSGPDFVAVPPHGKKFQAYWEGELAKANA
ncbi:MAG: hypothetical protein JWM27_4584 [Gemmatimonadetes bacterium]|nr:hypothetical protein [Gemmatimonadota bacterium]